MAQKFGPSRTRLLTGPGSLAGALVRFDAEIEVVGPREIWHALAVLFVADARQLWAGRSRRAAVVQKSRRFPT
ncbi:hypothetical protein [Nocardia beijingensis]|uniref:Uncharacterized protein n=1 Tax=Nocardia beijingensis TaxID=95162 RepID=A0ABW7WRA0_9NOCA